MRATTAATTTSPMVMANVVQTCSKSFCADSLLVFRFPSCFDFPIITDYLQCFSFHTKLFLLWYFSFYIFPHFFSMQIFLDNFLNLVATQSHFRNEVYVWSSDIRVQDSPRIFTWEFIKILDQMRIQILSPDLSDSVFVQFPSGRLVCNLLKPLNLLPDAITSFGFKVFLG